MKNLIILSSNGKMTIDTIVSELRNRDDDLLLTCYGLDDTTTTEDKNKLVLLSKERTFSRHLKEISKFISLREQESNIQYRKVTCVDTSEIDPNTVDFDTSLKRMDEVKLLLGNKTAPCYNFTTVSDSLLITNAVNFKLIANFCDNSIWETMEGDDGEYMTKEYDLYMYLRRHNLHLTEIGKDG